MSDKSIYEKMVYASILSEECSDDFDQALIKVTEGLAKRIIKLRDALVAVDADFIQEYDCTPEFFLGEDDPKPVDISRVDCVQLVVTKQEYYWEGLLDNTSIHWETSMLPIEELEALLIPPGELLKHAGREWAYEDAAKIFKERLANEC